MTLFASAGAAAHLFTGRRNIVEHPVVPVMKTSANPRTVSERSEHIDGCGESGLDEAADRLDAFLLRSASGRLTAGEILGDGEREFAPTRLVPSA